MSSAEILPSMLSANMVLLLKQRVLFVCTIYYFYKKKKKKKKKEQMSIDKTLNHSLRTIISYDHSLIYWPMALIL